MTSSKIQERAKELEQSPWRTIKKAAQAVGIESIPESESWVDHAQTIAELEFALKEPTEEPANEPEEIPQEPEEQPQENAPDPSMATRTESASDVPVPPNDVPDSPSHLFSTSYPTEFYRTNGIPFCETCGEKLLADTGGSPLCPERLGTDCPRL